VRSLARLAAACAVAVTVCLGPAAWAATGSPPPPASCFRVDATGNYPTCTLVHGTWVRGDVSTSSDNPTAVRVAIGGGLAVALLVLWAAIRAGRSRRAQAAADAAIPVQPDAIDLDAGSLALTELLNIPD
jgi:predicted lysophospholipase L1 biosynthesis ABC-type transport system permease subunit